MREILLQLCPPQLSRVETVQAWANVIQAIFTSSAFVIGGIWVWFNFKSRREFRKRLEPNVGLSFRRERDRTELLIEYTLKSIGYARVNIKTPSVIVYASTPEGKLKDQEKGVRADWRHVATFNIFERHDWIEFDETIRDSEVLTVPGADYLAFKVDMTVYTEKKRCWEKSLEWNTTAIVFKDSAKGDQDEPT